MKYKKQKQKEVKTEAFNMQAEKLTWSTLNN